MSFTPSKTILVSFNQIISTSYNLSGNPINTNHSHKDLGVIVSDNLNWNLVRHIGPVSCTKIISSTIPMSVKVKLYYITH